MSDLAIYVSGLSLIVAGVTLYLTQFRPPRLRLIVGSTVGLNHQTEGWSLYAPLTFTNEAHRPGLVNRCSAVLTFPNGGQTSHYIEWTEFRKRDEDKNQYTREDFAGPVQVEGRASVSKLVWFRWRTGSYSFPEGKYRLELVVWKEDDQRPSIREQHEFFLDAEDAGKLAEFKAGSKTTIRWFGLDKQIESNKQVTPHELEKLLS